MEVIFLMAICSIIGLLFVTMIIGALVSILSEQRADAKLEEFSHDNSGK
jgi:hypothetical protein